MCISIFTIYVSVYHVLHRESMRPAQDNSSMCHLMPDSHLQEWREEGEQIFLHVTVSGVARAFPGGRVAHPERQSEEENK